MLGRQNQPLSSPVRVLAVHASAARSLLSLAPATAGLIGGDKTRPACPPGPEASTGHPEALAPPFVPRPCPLNHSTRCTASPASVLKTTPPISRPRPHTWPASGAGVLLNPSPAPPFPLRPRPLEVSGRPLVACRRSQPWSLLAPPPEAPPPEAPPRPLSGRQEAPLGLQRVRRVWEPRGGGGLGWR